MLLMKVDSVHPKLGNALSKDEESSIGLLRGNKINKAAYFCYLVVT